jgi:ABC-type Zn uptake system ZnuABC Zn-binding protein ZnuA
MKPITVLAAFALVATVIALPSATLAELSIVTTTTDFADLAHQVGGDKVKVHSVMKGPESLHNVIPKPTEMVALNKADLFVHSGLDAEPWRDNLLKGARNPRVMPGKPGNVDMSDGIALRDVPEGKVDRSMGDVHAFGDPHYTASPANALRMTATLVRAMAAADPANADLYRQNAKRLVVELADLHKELKGKLAPYAGLKVVTFHKAWGYFADAFGIEVAGTIEPKPGITPSPAEVKKVIDAMRREGVKVVIVETYSDAGLARSVANQAGAVMIVLPDHVHGTSGVETYQDLFRHNVDRIIEAAQSAGAPAREAAGAR